MKGCFVGQETVAKTVSSNAVRRHLCGLEMIPSQADSLSDKEQFSCIPAGSKIVDDDGTFLHSAFCFSDLGTDHYF
jgi:folate-binding Fe-S cluster repair protein YgfZ